jgi:signal recognition particle subunit SEC65
MKFKGKSSEPNRVKENVWNPKTNKVVAIIENGIYETENEDIIEQLKELNYEIIEEQPIKIEEPKETFLDEQIRKLAKEYGIKTTNLEKIKDKLREKGVTI